MPLKLISSTNMKKVYGSLGLRVVNKSSSEIANKIC